MTHFKVCMIIISCLDSTLHFNVFITTHMGALVRLWKGKGSILGHYFPSWLKIIAATRESIDTELMNRVAPT